MGSLRVVLTPTTANPNVGDLYLDDSGQLEWVGGDITDEQSYARMVIQRVRCRLMFIRGEWYLDQRQGTPWRERVWAKGVTAGTIRRVVREVVETTPGVEALSSLSVLVDRQARTASITLVAITDLGTEVTTDMLDGPMIIEVPHG